MQYPRTKDHLPRLYHTINPTKNRRTSLSLFRYPDRPVQLDSLQKPWRGQSNVHQSEQNSSSNRLEPHSIVEIRRSREPKPPRASHKLGSLSQNPFHLGYLRSSDQSQESDAFRDNCAADNVRVLRARESGVYDNWSCDPSWQGKGWAVHARVNWISDGNVRYTHGCLHELLFALPRRRKSEWRQQDNCVAEGVPVHPFRHLESDRVQGISCCDLFRRFVYFRVNSDKDCY